MLTAQQAKIQASCEAGTKLLARPLLPLVRIVQFVYLSGPYKGIEPLLAELPAELEVQDIRYEAPADLLRPMLPVLRTAEAMKKPAALRSLPVIQDEQRRPLNPFKAMELWVGQQVLTRELERINSLLCEPRGCTLCCVGPDAAAGMRQHFFEIPLRDMEVAWFNDPLVDTEASRRVVSMTEPPLVHDNRPFYEGGRALYRWRNGWSLILPRNTACAQLDSEQGRCRIYAERPEACRRPQIFPYLLEKQENAEEAGTAYIFRNKLLAVWDCPSVRDLKNVIARYAELSGLEPVFMENKG
ncbi:MAG: hypothetical protein A2521_09810 [Deltaproteobacteria bacterium RIFOXYD12_FULL_57_12]|nr:MAG: hypothetical protein A2521_09810 [Deltaproteobacteria bacterium RIFOXYD12_FULL_57_12]